MDGYDSGYESDVVDFFDDAHDDVPLDQLLEILGWENLFIVYFILFIFHCHIIVLYLTLPHFIWLNKFTLYY